MLNSAGVNYWEPPKGPCTPNDIVVPGTFECYGWWENHSSLVENVTPSEASLSVPSTWTTVLMSIVGGQTDPVGGTAAYRLSESSDGAPSVHYATSSKTNCIASYQALDFWAKPVNRDWLCVYSDGSGGTGKTWINLSTGTVGVKPADVSMTLVGTSGAWTHWLYLRNESTTTVARVLLTDGDGSTTYTGDGRDNCDIYNYRLVQTRAAAILDRSLNLGVPRGHNLVQPTTSVQQLYNQNGWLNDIADGKYLLTENGRSSYSTSVTPNLTGVVAGTDQAYAIIGCGSMSGGAAQLHRWYYNASNHVFPFSLNGANVESIRQGASGLDTQPIGVFGAGFLSSMCSYAYIFNANRSGGLYIDGTLLGSFTHGAVGAVAMSPGQYYNSNPATNTSKLCSASAVYKGQVPGTTLDDQHNWLLRALGPMAARWGVVL